MAGSMFANAKFTGKEIAMRRMRKIPEAVKKAAAAQLEKNAIELVETMKSFAPVKSGDLKDSIHQYDVSDESKISRRVTAGGGAAYYAPWVEFGHGEADPHPFFWPVYRLKRKAFRRRMAAAARKALREIS